MTLPGMTISSSDVQFLKAEERDVSPSDNVTIFRSAQSEKVLLRDVTLGGIATLVSPETLNALDAMLCRLAGSSMFFSA